MPDGRPDRVTLAAFALLILTGGLNALAVRFSNFELPPFWNAAARFGAAAMVFGALALALRVPRPRGGALAGIALFGVLNFGAGYAMAYWALGFLQAGLAQLLLALVPLFTLLFAVAHRVEPFRWRALAGAALAVAGMAVIGGDQLGAGAPLLALAAAVGTSACFAEASVMVKRFPSAHPVSTNALAMLVGAGLLLGLSAAAGEARPVPDAGRTWLALGYLVVVGSVAVFWLYLFVLTRWTASSASYQYLLYPLVTLSASAWLDGERVTPGLAGGGALVLLGVYVGAFAGARAKELRHRRPGTSSPLGHRQSPQEKAIPGPEGGSEEG